MIPLTQAANQGRFASGASNSSSGLSHRNCGYFHARFPGVPPMAGGRVIKRKLNNRACLDKFEPPAARAGRQSLPSGVLQRHLEGFDMTATLIPIFPRTLSGETVQTVDARELHRFLKVEDRFTQWISRRIGEYEFLEGQDFVSFSQIREKISLEDENAMLKGWVHKLIHGGRT